MAFVDKLDDYTSIKKRFAGVIGGSLGGNMGLRLGRRDIAAHPWLTNGIVSWDPASVWHPMVEDITKGSGPKHCRDKWNENENDAFSRDHYFKEVFDGKIFDSGGTEKPISEVITKLLLGHTQPEMWYRDNWLPCKISYIATARSERQEIYNQYFRRWHWRVAGEQLIYSHVDHVNHEDLNSPYRYEKNQVRQLLAAGVDDNYKYTNIFEATFKLASWMSNTPGRSLFLINTGHSIHVERPHYLAEQIASFFTVEA